MTIMTSKLRTFLNKAANAAADTLVLTPEERRSLKRAADKVGTQLEQLAEAAEAAIAMPPQPPAPRRPAQKAQSQPTAPPTRAQGRGAIIKAFERAAEIRGDAIAAGYNGTPYTFRRALDEIRAGTPAGDHLVRQYETLGDTSGRTLSQVAEKIERDTTRAVTRKP